MTSEVEISKEEPTLSENCHDGDAIEKLKFKWCQEVPQYGDKLLQRLDEFRKRNLFYDVTLKTTDAELPAHKVVLAACGGVFRSHFVDAKTKRIANDVNDIAFACPAVGLKSILKFAYSGTLEVTQRNLFPTLLAALITEMKEVQEICSEISLTRLGWLTEFDGSETTLVSLNLEGKSSKDQERSLSLDEAFKVLQTLLEFNAPNFPPDSELFKKNDVLRVSNYDVLDVSTFPCMYEVKARWPERLHVYVAVIKCLQKAKEITKENLKQEEKTQTKEKNKSNAEENKTEIAPVNTEEAKPVADPIASALPATSADQKEKVISGNGDPTTDSTRVVKVNDAENATSDKPTPPKPIARKLSAKELPKPIPRSSSIKTHRRTSSADNVEAPKKKVSQRKEQTIQTASPKSHKLNPAPLPPSGSRSVSPFAPRKKAAAPKPPGPTPSARSTTSHKPSNGNHKETETKTLTMASHASSTTAGPKIPPPRPKPPSSLRKKSVDEKRESMTSYDESLNPFSEDPPDEDQMKAVNQTIKNEDTQESNTTKEPASDYDDSLNPFG